MTKHSFQINDGFEKYLSKISRKIPDGITGKKANFEKEFFRIYGARNVEQEIDLIKKENLKRYLLILGCTILFIILIGLSIALNDSDGILIDEKGHVALQRPFKGKINIPVTASGKVDGKQWHRNVMISLSAEGSNSVSKPEKKTEKEAEETANSNLSQLLRTINTSDTGKVIYLPNKIDGIQELEWKKKDSNEFTFVLVIAMGTVLFAYLKRYDSVKKLGLQCQDSISRELPDFLNKMVLLMNAGLVLTAAFDRIIKDYGERKFGHQSYFYDQLEEINTKIIQVNAPLIIELRRFAERSRHRELMRLISIMADNLDKGTELVSKLQAESSFLWFERKKKAEEQGKLAETKLTIPLAIQLLVLIIITVAPALMEM